MVPLAVVQVCEPNSDSKHLIIRGVNMHELIILKPQGSGIRYT